MRSNKILLFVFLAIVSMAGTAFAGSGILVQDDINSDFIAYNEIHANKTAMTGNAEEATGMIPDTIDFSYLGDTNKRSMLSSYVPYYDLREKNKVTSVKDQGSCGSCWTFASYGSLESTLMPGQNLDFSEQNMKNLHGFDRESCSGGNYQMATAYLARWDGPVPEANDPYDPDSSYSPSLDPVKHVQEVLFIPMRQSDLDNNALKSALQQYGAISSSMMWSETYYNSANHTYYYTGTSDSGNHGVTIVGWDDNFDRHKFSPAAPGNGAFIIKNSWSDSWGDDGYFYISYYDYVFARTGISAVFTAEDTGDFDKVYQYDPLGLVKTLGYKDIVAWGANVFTAGSQETLDAVSFYTTDSQTSYEVFIYTDPVSGPLGNLKSTVSGTFADSGYHTVDLDEHVNLAKGQKFSVVIKFTTSGYGYPLSVESPYSGYSSAATSNTGESYVSYDGTEWEDIVSIYAADTNLCIKAFTSTVPADWNPWNDPDSANGEKIALSELQTAIYDWRFGITLTTGEKVDLTRLQGLIYSWRFGI